MTYAQSMIVTRISNKIRSGVTISQYGDSLYDDYSDWVEYTELYGDYTDYIDGVTYLDNAQ